VPHFVDNITVENLSTTNAVREVMTSTATTLNGTLTLTIASTKFQVFTGTAAGFSIVLPNATTLLNGWKYEFSNTTTSTITVKTNGGAALFTLDSNSTAYIGLVNNVAAAGTWVFWQVLSSSIATGIININLVSSTTFTTTSATDVVITGFSLTPLSGTYGIWYNASAANTTNNANTYHSIYKNAAAIVDSIRPTQSVSSNFIFQQSTQTVANFNGTDTVSIYVRTSTGTLTVTGRSLLLIRLGP